MASDYYAVLGVSKDATATEIKKAFRQIARECHPDVAGEDSAAAERFKRSREAYETLVDPVTRARYDRRGRRAAGDSFFDAFWRESGGTPRSRRTGPSYGAHDAGGHSSSRRKRDQRGNDLDLEDLFNGFGDFGFGDGPTKARRPGGRVDPRRGPNADKTPPTSPRAAGPSSAEGQRTRRDERASRESWGDPAAGFEGRGTPRPPPPEPGSDVYIDLEVPEAIAGRSGTVTATYYRMKRSDSWRPGQNGTGLVRVQDIADVRIMPGTPDGAVLRERGLGDAGAYGGPYGDLVVRVHVQGARAPEPPPPRQAPRRPPPEPRSDTRPPPGQLPREPERRQLDIGPGEAVLGARVELQTPTGRVNLRVPPGSSSGRVMRLRGKGHGGVDLLVELRIVVPKNVNAESEELMQRFMELNPPRR